MRDQRFVAVHRGGPLTLEYHRLLIHWARKCVLHVSPLLEDALDERLTHALETAEAWAQGKAPVGAAMQAAYKCHAAARDAVTPTATLVSRAVGQMVATAHMADHSLGAVWYALKAVNAAGVLVEDERGWQNEQLPLEIPSNARLLVTVLETPDLERGEWAALAAEQLARAYACIR